MTSPVRSGLGRVHEGIGASQALAGDVLAVYPAPIDLVYGRRAPRSTAQSASNRTSARSASKKRAEMEAALQDERLKADCNCMAELAAVFKAEVDCS